MVRWRAVVFYRQKREPLRDQFLLDPDIAFLNHGSYGACPRPVFEAYQRWQLELEHQPVAFFRDRRRTLLAETRVALGAYLNAPADDLALVTNATVGVNTVAHSLDLQPGDEILLNDQEYGAIRMTWEYYAAKTGAVVVEQPIPLPVTTPEAIVETLWQAVTPRTKVISLSHITSPSSIILPVEQVCARAREAGILTMVDGAHALGQIDVDLQAIGADFYTGNCHKWMCTPKGSGILYVRPELQALIDPLVISWDSERENPFQLRHEWSGTRDLAAFLAIPAAIQFMAEHDWPAQREHCHALLRQTRQRIQTLTGLEQIVPDSPQWYSQMASLPLPPLDLAIYGRLFPDYGVEVPVLELSGRTLIRVSIQVYNNEADTDRLLDALRTIIERT